MSIYDYQVKDAEGKVVSLADYKEKLLLVVNTATGCGFTPQYEGLQKLYDKYQQKGLEILDFPCNQFGHQAPGTEKEIVGFCQLNYGVTFKQFAKVEVNGKNEDPLFTFLKKEQGGILGAKIKWNFTKFLINQRGEVVKRYAPAEKPENIEKDIIELLKEKR
ncbi:glutathione peroxidase [Anaeromicropila populeti]|uniref:Glutathione peroxidase n=1 Tax=Anaeromicropila populeti TaxID=37658 RepID=A0A1I6LCI8_9FIRM|nr:glutathione peroxidase [Anaeromicropila populeti]SFS01137.1 glutathione peroxidase [Anaeromicropila populeti]